MLFLAALVLAFAQPYFSGNEANESRNRLQAIYIDNSGSMSLKKGELRLLEIAKQAAYRQVKAAPPGTKFVLLTNDNPTSYRPLPADKTIQEINNVEISAATKTAAQVFSLLHSVSGTEGATGTDLYYYSDFQKVTTAVAPAPATTEHVRVYAIPLVAGDQSNVYIDTAYLSGTVIQANESNELVVRTRLSGTVPEEPPVLTLHVNGRVKSALTLDFDERQERTDTLSFRADETGWQKIELVLDDRAVRFDDTFRITARNAPNLSVLVLNQDAGSPFIQAAYRAYNGFRVTNALISNPPPDWKEYSLVILHGITSLGSDMGRRLSAALQKGQSICIFPGKTSGYSAFNEGLKELGDISVSGIDTSAQAAATLQQGNELVRNIFEQIPENVQLPVATWHYIIQSGITANAQSILSFRSGDPMLVQYRPHAGSLYILSGSIDMQSGDFATGYFFAPFLYQAAVQSNGGNVYALGLGNHQPAYIPVDNNGERSMVRLYAHGVETIPNQQAYGAGLNVFVDEVVKDAGFYPLVQPGKDTTIIAINPVRSESQLATADADELEELWRGAEIRVIDPQQAGATAAYNKWGGFPLWKVCVILALLMLAAETWVLASSLRKTTPAAQ